jgi:hypothetical protein
MLLTTPVPKSDTFKLNFLFVPYSVLEDSQMYEIQLTSQCSYDQIKLIVAETIQKNIPTILASKKYSSFSLGFHLSNHTRYDHFAFEVPDEIPKYIPVVIKASFRENFFPYYTAVSNLSHIFLVSFDLEIEITEDCVNSEIQKRIQICYETKTPPSEEMKSKISNTAQTFTLNTPSHESSTFPNFQFLSFCESKLGDYLLEVPIDNNLLLPESSFDLPTLMRQSESQRSSFTDIKEERTASLEQCFLALTQLEKLDEENQWFCPNCREFVCAEKTMRIWSIPECLIIHLKDFLEILAEKSQRITPLLIFQLK